MPNSAPSFSTFVHSEENVKSVFDHIDEVHRAGRGGRLDEKVITHPSAVKAALKDALKEELEAPEVRKLIARAEAVYESLRPMEPRTLGCRPHEVFYAAIFKERHGTSSVYVLRNSEYAQPDDRCA